MSKPTLPHPVRRFVRSAPAITVLALVLLYLGAGFLLLPALARWQIEKQVLAELGHRVSIGALKFNPLTLRLDVEDMVLAGTEGQALAGFKRLRADLEWRSLVARAWTLSEASLEAPVLHVELAKDGRHNFSALFDRLGAGTAPAQEAALPRLVIGRLRLDGGRIDYADHGLAQPAVARVEPLQIEVDGLSTLPGPAAAYKLTARTGNGEALALQGEAGIAARQLAGRLDLNGLQVATLVRALSRQLEIAAPAGQIDLSARFDLALDAQGEVTGLVQAVDAEVRGLSASRAGAKAPLLELERLALSQGRLDLGQRQFAAAALKLDKGRATLTLEPDGSIDWSRLVRRSAPSGPPANVAPWRAVLDSVEVSALAAVLDDAAGQRSVAVDALGLAGALNADFSTNLVRVAWGKPTLSLVGLRLADPVSTLDLPQGEFNAGRLTLTAGTAGLELALEAPRLVAAQGLTARQRPGISFAATALSAQGGRVGLKNGDGATRLDLDAMKLAITAAVADIDGQTLRLREGGAEAQRSSLNLRPQRVELALSRWRAPLADLQWQRGADRVDLRVATLGGAALAIVQAGPQTQVQSSTSQLSASGLAAHRGADRLAWQDATLQAGTLSATFAAPGSTATLVAGDASLQLSSGGVVAFGAGHEIGQLSQARLTAARLRVALPDGPADVDASGLALHLSGAALRSPADAAELLRLDKLALDGGALRLPDRFASADKLVVTNGKASTWLDAQGQFNLVRLFADDVAPPAAPASTPPAWRLQLKEAELDGLALDFEDRRESPALALGLEAVQIRARGIDNRAADPMQLALRADIVGGGQVSADGSVRADSGAVDLRIQARALPLAPLQSRLSQFAALRLASGTVSAAGRLRHGDPSGAGARLVYEGGIVVDGLLIEELAPVRPFLSWASLATDDVHLSIGPDRLDIGELRLERPAGRVLIAADQTVNLVDVLKPREPPPVAAAAATSARFPVSVARLRINDGVLDFADLSLRPQFATRMHDLKGVITGLGTDASSSARLQLDAQVDRYGSARIRGQLNVLHPQRATEVEMAFRNLELSTLSPYVAKFAGYRIAGGRLALDLQYQLEDRRLRGANKVVLNEVELGEKIDSPDALDLPLELAIAILKDADGVIDIELPVSGDLDDPKFDYGTVIGKAVGNLLGGIVTAPFRALGALFGGGKKEIDTIGFAPGHDVIAPPEREKLDTVARALNERPGLTLLVPPVFAADQDLPVLKSLAVRSEIVGRMGIKLAPGEDPGPVDTANPRVQRAVEAAFSQRYAPEVLAALKQRAVEAAAPAAPASPPASPSAPAPAPVPQVAPAPPANFYQGLVDRLIAEAPLGEPALLELARRRGDAVARELTATHGVPAARVLLGDVQPAATADAQVVTLKLALEVTR